MLYLFRQIFAFMKVYQNYWLAPIIFGLLAVGGWLILLESSAVAPFIYALF